MAATLMTPKEQAIEHLTQVFQSFEHQLNGEAGSTLHALRKKSFEALQQVHFPDRKHEDWKYTSVQRLMAPPYQLAPSGGPQRVTNIPGLDSYVLPVINGEVDWREIESWAPHSGINIIPLQKAIQNSEWSTVLAPVLEYTDPTSGHAFALLNLAFQNGGFVIDIPKGLMVDKPIEIRIVHDSTDVSFSNPMFVIRCGQNSQVRIIERYEGALHHQHPTQESLINAAGHILLDRNAGLQHIKWQDLPGQQHLVYQLKVHQSGDSRFVSYAFDFGGQMVRNNVDVELLQSNTYTSLMAGFIAKGTQSMDHQTCINHKVPHCESHELYRGILDDKSSAAFNGKVFVHPDAQKTNAFQQNDTLVLSPNALMNSKPQLEIFADDVKCSHGATIGQLDGKSLFYLMARGIDPQTATHMLKAAFLAQVLDAVPVEPLSTYIRNRMSLEL